MLQADVAVCGEHSSCSGQGPCSLGGLSLGAARLFPPRRAARVARGFHVFFPGAACLFPLQRAAWAARGLAPFPLTRCAFSLCSERPGQPEVWRPLHGCGSPFPSAASGPGSQRFGALSTGAPRLFPPRSQHTPLVGSQEVFRQEPGPVCRVGGAGFSGAEFAPFPSPLPPTSSGDGAALLWSFSVPLFCEPPAVCSCRSIFLLLSHSLKNSPSNCSQGLLAGPYPKECRRLLSIPPPLAGGGCGRLGVLFCWELLLGT